MQTPQTKHDFTRHFTARVIHPKQHRFIPPAEEPPLEAAMHDFLVLNPRADLLPNVATPACRLTRE